MFDFYFIPVFYLCQVKFIELRSSVKVVVGKVDEKFSELAGADQTSAINSSDDPYSEITCNSPFSQCRVRH